MQRPKETASCLLVLGIALFLCFSPESAYGNAADVRLTVGQGWAVVREMRTVRMVEGEQVITFEDIPREAELSTLCIRSRRVAVSLLEWERIGQIPEEAQEKGSLVYRREEDRVEWSPRGTEVAANDRSLGLRDAVRCLIDAATPGRRTLELVYLVRGLGWSPHYEIVVRGELEKERRVAVDIHSQIRIRNECSRSFSDATVYLVGTAPISAKKSDKPGFLMVEKGSPLSELWLNKDPDEDPGYSYRIPESVDISRQAETEVTYLRAERVPAKRLFFLDTSSGGRNTRGDEPMQKLIVFSNVKAHGLGWIFPPGPADIFLGSKRRHVRQMAEIPRTPVNADIKVDLGEDTDVVVRRERLGRSSPREGEYEEVHEIFIENRTPYEVAAEIEETPSTILEWSLIRATGVHEKDGKILRFLPKVDPSETKRIQYRLKITEPKW